MRTTSEDLIQCTTIPRDQTSKVFLVALREVRSLDLGKLSVIRSTEQKQRDLMWQQIDILYRTSKHPRFPAGMSLQKRLTPHSKDIAV